MSSNTKTANPLSDLLRYRVNLHFPVTRSVWLWMRSWRNYSDRTRTVNEIVPQKLAKLLPGPLKSLGMQLGRLFSRQDLGLL